MFVHLTSNLIGLLSQVFVYCVNAAVYHSCQVTATLAPVFDVHMVNGALSNLLQHNDPCRTQRNKKQLHLELACYSLLILYTSEAFYFSFSC